MKRLMGIMMILVAGMMMTACDDAMVAKHNMDKAANNFELERRVIMYNAITGNSVMVTEGKCSVENDTFRTSIICKIGKDEFIRNFYGRSDNISYIVEQMGPVPVNVYHYRRTFKPQSMLPDIDFRGSMKDLGSAIMPDESPEL